LSWLFAGICLNIISLQGSFEIKPVLLKIKIFGIKLNSVVTYKGSSGLILKISDYGRNEK